MADTTETLDLRKDGTILIRFDVDGQPKTWRLRRPKLGELRKLHERWKEDVAEPIRAADGDRAQIEALDLDTKVTDWISEAVDLLGDAGPLPPSDELPPWLANAGLGSQFILHWRTVPLASGA